MRKLVLAITGASGIIYGIKLFEELLNNFEVSLILSHSAVHVMKLETEYKSLDEFKKKIH